MEHSHAVDSNAVERYLLSEMSPEEQDEFEDHYFSCTACADGVRAASRFRDAARLHLDSAREPAREAAPVRTEPRRRWWWTMPQLVPAGIAAALACVVVYQASELRQRPAGAVSAQAMVSVALHGVTRGAPERIPPGGDFFNVYFDVPASAGGEAYECLITADGGKLAARIDKLEPRTDGSTSLLLPRVNFPKGSYTISLRKDRIVVSQLNFTVE
jgi:hypothetical protein